MFSFLFQKQKKMEIDETHPRTILHFDIDYYYAQVEELLDPSLKTKAFGIQQNYHIVTCNYVARAKGVDKWMLLTDALKKCPDLVLVNGEDTTKYKEFSAKIFEVMHKFTSSVERLGMDENWLDVTDIIEKRMKELDPGDQPVIEGCTFPEDGVGFDSCSCGCARRMILATHLAKEIRTALFEELG
jgi:DNA polymerase iota